MRSPDCAAASSPTCRSTWRPDGVASARRGGMELVEQPLLERGRAGERNAVRNPVSSPSAMATTADQHRDAQARAGSIRRRRASASSRRRPARRPEAPAPARWPPRPHRRAAAARSGRSRPAAPRPSGSGPAPARRRAPRAGRSRRRAAATAERSSLAASGASFGGLRQPRRPRPTSGRVSRSDKAGNSSAMPNRASSAIAATRPYWLASTAQPPPTAARVATAAKVAAMPDQHRQAAAHERPVRAREHEGQHRQDAGADDRQHAAEIGQQEQDHDRNLSGSGPA